MVNQPLIDRIQEGEALFGIHTANALNAKSTATIARTGIDFVFIDTEHTPLDRETISWMCHFYSACGVSPAVRVPYPNRHWISMAMDAGAEGIVVPYVETVEEAAGIARAVKYRPLKGKRAEDHQSGQQHLNEKTQEYLQAWNRNRYALIGIESVPAMENLDDLMNVEGIDGVFIGPHDLSVSMEIPEEYDHPDFLDAVETVLVKARQAELIAGMHIKPESVPLERLHRWIQLGLNWIVYSSDIDILAASLQGQLEQMKNGLES